MKDDESSLDGDINEGNGEETIDLEQVVLPPVKESAIKDVPLDITLKALKARIPSLAATRSNKTNILIEKPTYKKKQPKTKLGLIKGEAN